MVSIIENAYLKSPAFLQNIAVSIKGLSIERFRRSGSYQNFLDQIKSRDHWSPSMFRAYQDEQVRKLMDESVANTPLYRDLYRQHGIDPREITNVEELARLPLLSKEHVRKNQFGILNNKFKRGELAQIKTTGTTGTPLVVFTDAASRQLNYAFFDWFMEQAGANLLGRRATFGGRLVVNSMQKKPPFWRYSFFQKNLLCSSYHMDSCNLDAYVRKLQMFVPEIIDSYPSSLYVLAKYMLENNLEGIRPNIIVTSAETLYPEQKAVIEEAFKCRVSDQYGAAEMCVFAYLCREGNYHIRPDYGVVEVIDQGEPVPVGEIGELVCTGFVNAAMPLVRYQIGDRGSLSDEKCACGSHAQVLKSLEGRIDDTIYTRNGTPIGRLSPVLKGFPVEEAIYIQDRIGDLVVEVVKSPDYVDATTQSLIAELRKRVGDDMNITVKFVERIQRNSSKKNRAVISNVHWPETGR